MKRSTLIAVAVFGVLTLLFVATREPQVTVGVQKLQLAPVSADAIVEMSFGPIVLKSEGGAWTVGNSGKRYPADEGQVKAATQGFAELKAEDFVSDRAEKHADLEVDGTKGVTVKASTASGVVRELVLGKASRSGGAYLREAKSNAVFTINGSLPYLAKRDLTSWRKKSISTFKLDEVSRVTFSGPTPWSLVSGTEPGSWKLEAPTAKDYRFDAAAAQQLMGQLANLSAQDFLEGPVEAVTEVKAELASGKSVTLRLGAKRPDGTYALAVEGDAQSYLLPGWQAEQLLKDPEGLRDLRLLHFDPAQVERFSLVAGGKKTIVAKEGESWKLVEPKTPTQFDAQQVGPQLTRIASMRGLKLVRDLVDPKPSIQLELTLKGGATQHLRLSETHARGDDGLLYAVNAGDKTWLETGEAIFKRPPPPPGGGFQGLDQLPPELRQQLEAQLRQQQR
ncbi:MAG: DUF4340 domain-containing protein [Archangium sp.]|nr:DUF4340 domain-containing protein [Archangium sp.]